MNFSVNFYKDFRYFNQVDEIILKYDKYSEGLIEAVQKYDFPQRIVVDVCGCHIDDLNQSLRVFKESIAAHPNLAFKILTVQFDLMQKFCEKYNVNYFFDERVNTFDTLVQYIQLDVSDIYLTDELAFFAESLIKSYPQVNFRFYPNVAQSNIKTQLLNIDNFKKFYIRPEDVEYYDYDNVIFEFFGPLDRQSVLYEIYNNRKWIGNLDEIIIGLEDTIVKNDTIAPMFGRIRSDCGKGCYRGVRCNICNRIKDLSDTMKNSGIEFRRSNNG